jgi:hypothetical protein
MRDLTYTVASALSVMVQFVVAFVIPYLYYAPYAALGPRTGFIFGSTSALTLVFIYLFVPECRNLTLEEIDHLFIVDKTPIRKFGEKKRGQILIEDLMEPAGRDKLDVSVEHQEVAGPDPECA